MLTYFCLLVFCTLPWITLSSEGICGGILEASSGLITSPGFPGPYPPNTSCVWDIHAPVRSNITLIFNNVDLQSESRNCPNGDYIQVWGELNSQSLWRTSAICGNISQALVIRNVDNRMRILFRSDHEHERNGFSASYTSIQERECGGELRGSFGDISSPRYPQDYPPDKRCVWDIFAPTGHTITLNFTDFELENKTSTCPDKVVIWSRLIGRHFRRQVKYCGMDLPPIFISKDNRLRIEFKSDRTVEGKGFTAHYTTDDRQPEIECNTYQFQCNQTRHCIPISWTCDGVDDCGDMSDETDCQDARPPARRRKEGCVHNVTQSSGQIVSPSYRKDDENGAHCSWHFETLAGHKMNLHFHDLSLVEYPDINQDCHVDRLTFHQGSSKHSPIVDYFCGLQELPLTIFSEDKELLMTLKTNKSTFWKGFNLTYETVCGGEFNATETPGRIFSHPEFGKVNYAPNISCTWSVTATEGRRVELNFTTFKVCQNETDGTCTDITPPHYLNCNDNSDRECGQDIYSDRVCESDFVEITEDGRSGQEILARFCGFTIPPRTVSTSNSLKIRFETNGSENSTGFLATYRSIDEQQ